MQARLAELAKKSAAGSVDKLRGLAIAAGIEATPKELKDALHGNVAN